MRRSTKGPEPSARGNFTPPRAADGSAVPEPPAAPAPAPRGGRLSPRNWRVATRLNAILLIPVAVGLVLGGVQVKGSLDTWQDADDAESTARLVRASLGYAGALYHERDVSAEPLLRGGGGRDTEVAKARRATDDAADAFDEAARAMPSTPRLERRLKVFRAEEPRLQSLRAAAYTSELKGVETEEGYTGVAHPLMEFANELGLGTGNVTSYGRTVYAVSLTKAALSLERSIGMHMLIRPGPDPGHLASQRVALSSYAYLERIAAEEYLGGGTEQDARNLKDAEKKVKDDIAALVQEARAKNPGGTPPPADPATMVSELARLDSTDAAARRTLAQRGITPENWWAVTTLKFDAYGGIEAALADNAVAEAAAVADDAERDAYLTGAAVVIALLAAFVLAGIVARQMSRSMRELRNAAFGIAEQRLPMLVDQLSRTDPGRVDTRVAPLPISSTDEIGEVARAFDQVHREAVRLASEQALLRGNINAIFTNLSRRNQSLIEGQIGLITHLENHEADPDQLENLFRLDHLATRMRRNGENLLVLAGEEPGRRWDRPVPLVDILRAASSEVEQYERIELSGVPEADIHGRAVTDLVHLLAELLENATTFSSPQTKVRVTATRLPDGRVVIEIHDKGIGLTAEDFADINHKLANPPTVDVAISQRMGLFVVGRLSDRHGIRVQLRPSGEQAGTTSLVMLPDAITHGGGGERQQRDEFTVSQIIPEQDARGDGSGRPQQPQRTAAELGFDDSRYADGGGAGPDPVGRSLHRGGRRAALGPRNGYAEPGTEHPAPSPGNASSSAGNASSAGAASSGGDGFPAPPSAHDPGADARREPYPGAHRHPGPAAPGGQAGHGGPAAYEGPLTPHDGQYADGGDPAAGYAGYAGNAGPEAGYGDPGGGHPQQAGYGDQGAGYGDERTGYADRAGYGDGTGYGQQQAGYGDGTGYGDQAGDPQQAGYAGQQAGPGDQRAGYADPSGAAHAAYDGGVPGQVHGDPSAYYAPGAPQAPAPGGPAAPPGHGSPLHDRPGPDGFPGGHPAQYPAGAPEGDAGRTSDGNDADRVGFDRPGPATSAVHELTDAGLPRRGSAAGGPGGAPRADRGATPPAAEAGRGDGDWRSANDERWQQASRLRKPKAGGITPSGLPRRVPKANLVEGTAETTLQNGPQISRAPEDIRGRLSNLRRGVERGRNAGIEQNTQATTSEQRGPDSTYDQER
ncbi:nitrate- and nitrite sensing domain-containing protein [Streptomyces sp. NPDC052077]|uniref:nitrate- and nitrite sensing domain-containing protein n=1 Tax=Streptomyces sp. NPDC052077 TaxID=3154757 RepID=UPI0034397EC0